MRVNYWVLSHSCLILSLFVGCSGKKEEEKTPEVTPAANTATATPAAAASTTPASNAGSGGSGGDYAGASSGGYAGSGGSDYSGASGGSDYSGAGGGYGDNYGGAGGQEYGGAGGGYGAGYGDSSGSSGYGGANSGYGGSSGDSGYGGSDGGYGGSGGGYGGSSGNASKPAAPLTWMEASTKAFEKGNEVLAIRFAKAAALASSEDATKVVEAVRWSNISQQPEMLTQVAVGYEIDVPEDIKEYNPIYYGRMVSENGSSGGSYGGGGDSYGGTDSGYGGGQGTAARKSKSSSKEKVDYIKDTSRYFHTELEKAAGLMATELIDFMQTAHAEGAWIPLFAGTKVEIKSPDKLESSSGGSGDGYGGGYGGSGSGGYGGGSDYGSGYGGGDSYGGGQSAPATKDPLADKIKDPEHARIAAGLHYIGSGKTGELVKKAKEANYQALVVYQIVVKPNRRTNYTQNECSAKLYNLNTGKVVATCRALVNDDVAEQIAKGKETFVKDAMAKLTDTTKKGLSLNPELPAAITAEIIKAKRLPTLVGDESGDKLDRVFELYFWKTKGLLTEADFQAACESILGEDGTKLAVGTSEEKTAVLTDLL